MFDEQGVPFVGSKALEIVYVQIALAKVIDVLTGTVDFKAKLWPLLISMISVLVFTQGGFSNPTEIEIDSLPLIFFDSNEK
jgi:hypothetical protein